MDAKIFFRSFIEPQNLTLHLVLLHQARYVRPRLVVCEYSRLSSLLANVPCDEER